jgi:hypothetical protein
VPDYKALLVDRLWTLIRVPPLTTAGDPAYVAARNMVDDRDPDQQLREAVGGSAVDASPRIRIASGRFTHSAYRRDAAFGSEDGSDGGQPVRRVLRPVVEVLSGEIRTGRQDVIEDAVQLAILAGGPDLGLSWVVPCQWEMEGTQDVLPVVRGADWCRLRTRLTLTVPCEWDARDLLA